MENLTILLINIPDISKIFTAFTAFVFAYCGISVAIRFARTR